MPHDVNTSIQDLHQLNTTNCASSVICQRNPTRTSPIFSRTSSKKCSHPIHRLTSNSASPFIHRPYLLHPLSRTLERPSGSKTTNVTVLLILMPSVFRRATLKSGSGARKPVSPHMEQSRREAHSRRRCRSTRRSVASPRTLTSSGPFQL